MKDNDTELIWEAYITEQTAQLTDEQLAEIRKKFYPAENDLSFEEELIPALQYTFKTGDFPEDLWAHTIEPVDADGLKNHLSKLKHGLLGHAVDRTKRAVSKGVDTIGKSVGKEISKWKFQSPVKRNKF